MTSSDASEDELLERIAALEEENKRLRAKLRRYEGPYTPSSKQQSSGDKSSSSGDDGSPRIDGGSSGRNPGHDPAYRDVPDPDREVEVACDCCPECGEGFDESEGASP